jgi:NADH dehydrogenase/NADH:ubiquinone oxidoreductase subunit G
MTMVTLTIDGEEVTVTEDTTIMDAAKKVNIRIPSLCYLQGLEPHGACGVCVVEVEEDRSITRSCLRPVQQGIAIPRH